MTSSAAPGGGATTAGVGGGAGAVVFAWNGGMYGTGRSVTLTTPRSRSAATMRLTSSGSAPDFARISSNGAPRRAASTTFCCSVVSRKSSRPAAIEAYLLFAEAAASSALSYVSTFTIAVKMSCESVTRKADENDGAPYDISYVALFQING